MFHVGAIIELIENDDLMNEEEEKVKFNKLSVLFHPKKKRKRDTHHRGEKSYRSCLPQNDAKETDRGALPSTEKKSKNSADDDVNDDDDDDKEEEDQEESFFAYLAVRVLLREEDGHVGGDKASPAGD